MKTEIPRRYADAHLSRIELEEKYSYIVIQWYKTGKNICFYSGNAGIGKTYLCYAVYGCLLDDKQNVRFFEERNFFNHLRSVIKEGWDYEQEIKRLCETDWFILDDIGSGQITDWQKEVLFSLVDNRYSSEKPTLITSNLSVRDLKNTYGERFASRIASSSSTILELKGYDRRQIEPLERVELKYNATKQEG